ncbi:hypothetical protein [Ulvibacter litoralis]|uniref:Lipocalin-like domain-containing protein n=1 Tax=Ulvibacter litoralis TaxID=227084 RepID=A0A1G7I031_9FLAO|nr:hypothetical protein [Ulvibacter litoralis]GHC62911.1 hypothetical protein GCM10008083_30210 [Ulvibacter litoralis]SDF06090.1 hypothetical protein SAMN05421855_10529 [Ulvibacter litoralis]
MKTRILILLVVVGFLFTSCDSEDDAPSVQNDELSGVWHFKSLQGGFAGVDFDFNENQVTWDFNSERNTLSVVNNLVPTDPQHMYYPYENNVYNYSVLELNGAKYLVVFGMAGVHDNDELGKYEITQDGNLYIDTNEYSSGGAIDGFMYTFTR